jgi:nucleotide-binding universal stress UspA family protein
MKQILVATDFSNCASNAMEYAVELAKILKIDLCAIHAIHPTEGIDNSVYNAIFIEDYYNNKREFLTSWAANFVSKEGYEGVKITTACEKGQLGNVLTKYIDSNSVEILVMGSMGATGISGLFGSNASMIVEKTKTPTLVIPLETKFSNSPVITLATDFSSKLSPEDVTALNDLIDAFKSDRLNVLNILETPEELKTNEAGENSLKQLIKNASLEFKYIHEDNPREGIMNFIQGNNTDILCVVKHHHNLVYRIFNRSTVTQVMNKSVKAILVLHE